MKRLGIDLDDVLNCFNEGWIAEYNKRSGDALTVEDITAWDIKAKVERADISGDCAEAGLFCGAAGAGGRGGFFKMGVRAF